MAHKLLNIRPELASLIEATAKKLSTDTRQLLKASIALSRSIGAAGSHRAKLDPRELQESFHALARCATEIQLQIGKLRTMLRAPKSTTPPS